MKETYVENLNPVTFSLNNNNLIIDKMLISEKSFLEISPYYSKSILYKGYLGEFEPIKIDNGKYLIGITETSEDLIVLHHGIMSVDENSISLYMDSYKVNDERFKQTITPMAAGLLYEVEPDNSMSQAMTIYNDYDVYGRIYDPSDIDWYKVQFPNSGSANFWLGNIPSGEDFELEVYNSAGTLLGYSRSASSQELITLNVSANIWYYIKVYGYNGSWSVSNYFLRAKVNNTNPYSAMGWTYFFADTSINKISSPFGPRTGGFHNGIDVVKHSGSILGTEILSVTAGTVARRYLNVPEPQPNWSMGYAISIKTYNIDPGTGQYLHTLYMHLRDAPLPSAVGNYVAKGERIGYVGNTGQSSGPHLHFQVTKNGAAWADGEANNVNPVYFFPSIFPQYQSYSSESFNIETYSSNNVSSDILIPLELVEYVGLEKFTEWIISQKNANNKSIEFDINEFREYFNITDDEFVKLVQTNNLEELYNTTDVISQKSIE